MKPGNGSTTMPNRPVHREVHLRDLGVVVFRHWRIVAMLGLLVPIGAYLAGRRAVPRWQSRLTVQVSSQKQSFSQFEDIRVDEMALRTDPVLSEALVLTTQRLALRVTDTLRLRLAPADPAIPRATLLADITIDSAPSPGEYQLTALGPAGFELRDAAGKLLSKGSYDDRANGPGFSFRVPPRSGPERTARLRLVSREEAAAWVSGGISYNIREGTNAFDILFTGIDPSLVPLILNQVALQLRRDGTERMLDIARKKTEYVAQQLASADSTSQAKLREMQRFKETEQITDLTAEGSSIVSSIKDAEKERQGLLVEISTLREAVSADSIGLDALNRLAAVQGTAGNTALEFQIQNLLKLYDDRRTLTAGPLGLQERNPQVDAIDQRIRQGHSALRAAVRAAAQSLSQRLRGLDAGIREMKERLKTFPGQETQIAQLTIESSIANETYRYLLGQYQAAQLTQATVAPYVTLLDGALPPYRIGTSLMQKVVLGLLVGLLLGLAGAFFLEYLDQTIKSASDVQRVVGVPVLGQIPFDPKLAGGGNGRRHPVIVITALSPDDPAAEAYRALRTNVTFVGADKPLQFIAVTSPGPGEGKSTTATNLAMTLAQSGNRTILIDGDLRRPLVHRAFDLGQEPGLTDILIGRATSREAIRPQVASNLDVLPAGAGPPNPSELLGSNVMHQVIGELRRQYDYIVIDTPPALPVTDAAVVATTADATILVLKSGDTEEVAAQRAVDLLTRVNARLAGAVLNGVDQRRDQYYAYYSNRARATRTPVKSLLSRLSGML
ncbi:MAG: polysaccharide biosynthesis tyrosine autokinase [Gemmatimonadetes bacterium]|nr:polysaccharide biosynthesis tyrosine autokinase [Gemmatimonadota bacterium]